MMETNARYFNILWHRDTKKMNTVKLEVLPVVRVTMRTLIKLEPWTRKTIKLEALQSHLHAPSKMPSSNGV